MNISTFCGKSGFGSEHFGEHRFFQRETTRNKNFSNSGSAVGVWKHSNLILSRIGFLLICRLSGTKDAGKRANPRSDLE
jgi:hypothetical protein